MKVSSRHVNYLESIQIYLLNSSAFMFLFFFACSFLGLHFLFVLASELAIVLQQGFPWYCHVVLRQMVLQGNRSLHLGCFMIQFTYEAVKNILQTFRPYLNITYQMIEVYDELCKYLRMKR